MRESGGYSAGTAAGWRSSPRAGQDTASPTAVIAGLDPAIHEAAPRPRTYVRQSFAHRFMGPRVKPGGDGGAWGSAEGNNDYAALRFAWISLRLISTSAIWMALSAAPLRRLSDTHHSTKPLSTVGSVRMRLI